jgi:hypothetical protein
LLAATSCGTRNLTQPADHYYPPSRVRRLQLNHESWHLRIRRLCRLFLSMSCSRYSTNSLRAWSMSM